MLSQVADNDPQETQEWTRIPQRPDRREGQARARYALLHMLDQARRRGVAMPAEVTSPYVNSIPVENEPYLGDEAITEAQVPRVDPLERGGDGNPRAASRCSVGGHISSTRQWRLSTRSA